jgi:hypothetical protein
MQIHSLSNSELNVSSAEARAVARPATAGRDVGAAASDSAGEAFPRALDAAPEARPEAVAKGRELYQQVPYPPTEIVQGISRLIARFWEGA